MKRTILSRWIEFNVQNARYTEAVHTAKKQIIKTPQEATVEKLTWDQFLHGLNYQVMATRHNKGLPKLDVMDQMEWFIRTLANIAADGREVDYKVGDKVTRDGCTFICVEVNR